MHSRTHRGKLAHTYRGQTLSHIQGASSLSHIQGASVRAYTEYTYRGKQAHIQETNTHTYKG